MHNTIGMSENLPTFIEAPSMGAKFSSLTKPLTPRWDSPRNLNRDFRLSSQKPCKVFKLSGLLQCQHLEEDHEDHLELGGRRELAAGKLEGDLHAAVPDVVVVLQGDDGYMMMSIVMTPCMVMTIDKCG